MSATGVMQPPIPIDDLDHLESILAPICGAVATVTQNSTYWHRIPVRLRPKTVTSFAVFNGATVAGNFAVGVWASFDGGVTITRLGGSASTAQAGPNAKQTGSLAAPITVPANVPLWLSFSSDSATATYLGRTGWNLTLNTSNRSRNKAAAYNETADQTIGSIGTMPNIIWVEIS